MYSTGPDAEVGIEGDANANYASHRGKDLGVSTWTGDEWTRGGGTTWGWYSYDPELNLFYYSSGNPGSWNPDQRPGDNKWSMTIWARNPETGKVKWAYQMTPHDEWDYDGVNERSEEHTSELQSLAYLVCRLLLEKKKKVRDESPMDIQKQNLHTP